MKSINEYLLDISSNNEILNIISEVLEESLLTEEEIEESFNFINESFDINKHEFIFPKK